MFDNVPVALDSCSLSSGFFACASSADRNTVKSAQQRSLATTRLAFYQSLYQCDDVSRRAGLKAKTTKPVTVGVTPSWLWSVEKGPNANSCQVETRLKNMRQHPKVSGKGTFGDTSIIYECFAL